MCAFELGQRLGVRVEVVVGEPAVALIEMRRSRQPSGSGMKSMGDASSTLIRSSSFSAGSARRSESSSGSILMSTSIVVGRQPTRTAVAPPVRKTSASSVAAAPNARMKRSHSANALGGSLEADESADECVVARMRRVGVLGREPLVQTVLR